MRTRCPACSTVFRVTPEQLRLKGGKVRCGQCHAVFNAFDSLIEDSPATATPPRETPEVIGTALPPVPGALPDAPLETSPGSTLPGEAMPNEVTALRSEPAAPDVTDAPLPPAPLVPDTFTPAAPPPATADHLAVSEASAPTPAEAGAASAPPAAVSVTEDADEAPADVDTANDSDATHAAREAGLVAARELADTPGFNRWAAGTLAAPDATFQDIAAPAHRLPFIVAALVLALLLLGQAAYQLRTTVVQHLPSALAAYQALDIEVPLPAVSDLVAIDNSDLQSDNARGLLLLQATLHNRAAFAQAWPALELTLTDTHDTVISRRVLSAADYLPPGSDPKAFPARHELAIRLWLDGKALGAAGYRLYVFYP